jgi:dTDP-4-amino-4,6-dideoxygalactose transaminase
VVNGGRASLTDQYARRMLGSNYRMTELQAALLIGQLDMLPELAALRARHAALLTQALSSCKGIRPLPRQPAITRDTLYSYVFQYRPADKRVHRDVFAAALETEGIPCDGRFYEPVYKSDLFYATPDNAPQLRIGRQETLHYDMVHSPVAERAAYEEAVWLPQFLLIGEEADVRDVHTAIEKVLDNLDELAQADPSIAGSKAMGRAQRARFERHRNY